MYMHHLCDSAINSTTSSHMPRNRSLSASNSTTSSASPALISRGFASIRRAHRRLSASSPVSPSQESSYEPIQPTVEQSNNNTDPPIKTHIRLVPNVGLSSRSFVFDVIDKELEPGILYRIGRFSDRNTIDQRLSFKSKVVSRNHAEIWSENGKIFIRDIGSSSGTFVNRLRLSPPSHESQPQEIKDGDTVQLGVDYQGGVEPIYRAVRIRIEINRAEQHSSPFTRTAFEQLRNQLIASHGGEKVGEDVQECCICLYAIAPFQALFVAPCSHVFHFKCLRPIVFQNYPGFSCPLCRNYFDLEASVAVEVEDVLEAMNQHKKEIANAAIDPVPEEEEPLTSENNPVVVVVPKESVAPASPSDEATSAGHHLPRSDALLSTTLVSPVMLEDMVTSNSSSSSS
ncbi:Putative Zinc finger, RING-type and FHA domain containing protein [Rhizopus microsporus]|nr:Putative Zinc finger, RING-type and FHA domain containing protein [Rhizopus microsporus]